MKTSKRTVLKMLRPSSKNSDWNLRLSFCSRDCSRLDASHTAASREVLRFCRWEPPEAVSGPEQCRVHICCVPIEKT